MCTQKAKNDTIRETCPSREFFSGPHLLVFGMKQSKSQNSFRIQEKIDQKKLCIQIFFRQ